MQLGCAVRESEACCASLADGEGPSRGKELSALAEHSCKSLLKAFSQISSGDPSSCLGKERDRWVQPWWHWHVLPSSGMGLGFFQDKVSAVASALCGTVDGQNQRQRQQSPQESLCVHEGSPGDPQEPHTGILSYPSLSQLGPSLEKGHHE